MVESRLIGPVRVVGAGLLGTSIGLGLRARGIDVILADASPTNLSIAVDYGAGRAATAGDLPQLIVVCVPPDVTAETVARELAAYPRAIVTDVASVKLAPLQELRALGADVSRYIGGHPMAGRERGGPLAGRADLFVGRPWVVAAHDAISYQQATAIDDLILDLGAILVEMSPEEHDRAVALISHVPQVVSTIMARRLTDSAGSALNLAGQGLRDVTRVAASDPELWVQILGANAEPVRDILLAYRVDLDRFIDALEAPAAPGARRKVAEELAGGNAGVARLPGKHGQDRRFVSLSVMVDDTPGQLARLLNEIGEVGVNLEDLRLEHSPGAQLGLAEISVLPEAVGRLTEELAARGWRIAG
ncbi:prephenate dehydrogenase [Cryobacterium sp. TMT2-18-3]|uniref:prephenate dehydrogenase n=1 Tax=unclassified Cryobacterium TaxID=2649013 RepID=UPI00106BC804|nr:MULTISPECIES: prephenate dehydrogenase [unclassified Cryobacterium]TFC28289.1 prephenate dehydrogenase [Cryobacterium sp. TMT2-18-2]TFC34147.1 prephenate dehydrogenase [Cryobacterium sp. TMT2-42-4]TFC62360.1 prephenate dehydrogenase [Cryobacterium sp. TMT2-18-3]